MCAVSVIFDYGRSLPIDAWNHQDFGKFQRLVREAEDFDKATGQPDCEDPQKAEWMRDVEKRLAELETA